MILRPWNSAGEFPWDTCMCVVVHMGIRISRGAEDSTGEAPLLDLLTIEQHHRLQRQISLRPRPSDDTDFTRHADALTGR